MAADPAPPAAADELARLRGVLERELANGVADRDIPGGLDALLIRAVEDGAIARGHPLYERIRALQRSGGYRALTPEGRRRWLERAAAVADPRAGPAERPADARGRPLAPDDPVTRLPGLGRSAAERFARLGVNTAADAARFFPLSYLLSVLDI